MPSIFSEVKHAAALAQKSAAGGKGQGGYRSARASRPRKRFRSDIKKLAAAIGTYLQGALKLTKNELYIKSLYYDTDSKILTLYIYLYQHSLRVEIAQVTRGSNYSARLIDGACSQYFLDCCIKAIKFFDGTSAMPWKMEETLSII